MLFFAILHFFAFPYHIYEIKAMSQAPLARKFELGGPYLFVFRFSPSAHPLGRPASAHSFICFPLYHSSPSFSTGNIKKGLSDAISQKDLGKDTIDAFVPEKLKKQKKQRPNLPKLGNPISSLDRSYVMFFCLIAFLASYSHPLDLDSSTESDIVDMGPTGDEEAATEDGMVLGTRDGGKGDRPNSSGSSVDDDGVELDEIAHDVHVLFCPSAPYCLEFGCRWLPPFASFQLAYRFASDLFFFFSLPHLTPSS
jgi:hypothetical protein